MSLVEARSDPRPAVVGHHEERWRSDIARLAEKYDQILPLTVDLQQTAATLRANIEPPQSQPVTSSHVMPLVVHQLIHRAYDDILTIWPVEKSDHPERNEVAAKCIAQLLDGEFKLDSPTTSRRGSDRNFCCAQAETRFIDSLLSAREEAHNDQNHIRILHDSAGKAVGWGKGTDYATALTLTPFLMGGLPVAAGTIVNPQGAMPTTATVKLDNGVTLQALEVGPRAVLTPHRLSAWAHENPLDRQMFALSYAEGYAVVSPSRAELLAKYSLDDFCTTAAKSLEICGIPTPT